MDKYEIRTRGKVTKLEPAPEKEETELVIDYDAEKIVDASKYSVAITLGLRCTDGKGPDFSRQIIVVSDNAINGYRVDEQRQTEIDNYLIELNK